RAGISGFCTELGHRKGWESIYVLPMIIEVALLAAFAIVLEVAGHPDENWNPSLFAMTGLAATAMGLQNATITRISNGALPPTHLTVTPPDSAQQPSHPLSWRPAARRNVPPRPARGLIHSPLTPPPARHILAAFALGAGSGPLAYEHFPRLAMFPPV